MTDRICPDCNKPVTEDETMCSECGRFVPGAVVASSVLNKSARNFDIVAWFQDLPHYLLFGGSNECEDITPRMAIKLLGVIILGVAIWFAIAYFYNDQVFK